MAVTSLVPLRPHELGVAPCASASALPEGSSNTSKPGEIMGQEPSLSHLSRGTQTDSLAAAGALPGSCSKVLERQCVPSSSILIK